MSRGKVGLLLSMSVYVMAVNNASKTASCNSNFPKKFLKEKLTRQEYSVTQEHGTEKVFTGKYWNNYEKGVYKCVVCEKDLFDSDTKFDSGSGRT